MCHKSALHWVRVTERYFTYTRDISDLHIMSDIAIRQKKRSSEPKQSNTVLLLYDINYEQPGAGYMGSPGVGIQVSMVGVEALAVTNSTMIRRPLEVRGAAL